MSILFFGTLASSVTDPDPDPHSCGRLDPDRIRIGNMDPDPGGPKLPTNLRKFKL